MATVYLVCGSTGAGKTTTALRLASEHSAVRFSIDAWMGDLFMADAPEPLSFDWMMERIGRAETRIWSVARQVLGTGGDVVLDLGFTTRAHRDTHRAWAQAAGAEVVLVLVDVPAEERWRRVQQRNVERDPAVFRLEVTREMFDFMEERWQSPVAEEGAVRTA